MKRWNVLGQIVGIVWAVFVLIGCSGGNSAISVSTSIKASLTPTSRPMPVSPPTSSTGIPAPGQWQASGNESGPFEFMVSSDGTAITKFRYRVSNFTCGSVTTSINSDISGLWPISNGEFTLDTAPNNPVDVVIVGAFDGTGRRAIGAWKVVVFGRVCPSSWTGDSAG